MLDNARVAYAVVHKGRDKHVDFKIAISGYVTYTAIVVDISKSKPFMEATADTLIGAFDKLHEVSMEIIYDLMDDGKLEVIKHIDGMKKVRSGMWVGRYTE